MRMKQFFKIAILIFICVVQISIFHENTHADSLSEVIESKEHVNGFIVTIAEERLEEGGANIVILLENTSSVYVNGKIEITIWDEDIKLGRCDWDIDGEKENLKYEATGNVSYEISIPEAISNKNATAKLTIPCAEISPLAELNDYYIEVKSNKTVEQFNVDDIFVIHNQSNSMLFGKYIDANISFTAFSVNEPYSESGCLYLYSSDSLTEAKYLITEDTQSSPWDIYEENITRVVITGIDELGAHALDSCTNINEIYFYDRDMIISDDIFSNIKNNEITIYGYYDSYAEEYAKKKGYKFVAFDASSEGKMLYWNNDADITWKYDSDKKELVISGTGHLSQYSSGGVETRDFRPNLYISRPWGHFDEVVQTLRIEGDITGITSNLFREFTALKDIYISESVNNMVHTSYYNGTLQYHPVFNKNLSDETTIHCKAGTGAEAYAFTYKMNYKVDGVTKGDVNNDAVINAEDSLYVLKAAAKLETPLYYQSDYNEDYVLNAMDALLILKNAADIAK